MERYTGMVYMIYRSPARVWILIGRERHPSINMLHGLSNFLDYKTLFDTYGRNFINLWFWIFAMLQISR